jgi:hypothetical protein
MENTRLCGSEGIFKNLPDFAEALKSAMFDTVHGKYYGAVIVGA